MKLLALFNTFDLLIHWMSIVILFVGWNEYDWIELKWWNRIIWKFMIVLILHKHNFNYLVDWQFEPNDLNGSLIQPKIIHNGYWIPEISNELFECIEIEWIKLNNTYWSYTIKLNYRWNWNAIAGNGHTFVLCNWSFTRTFFATVFTVRLTVWLWNRV